MQGFSLSLRTVLQYGKRAFAFLEQKLSPVSSSKDLSLLAVSDSFTPASGQIISASQRVERILKHNILPFWFPNAIDMIHGGYKSYHRLQGGWDGPRPRHLVAQSRTLWFFSRLARSPWGTVGHLDAARHGFQFLRDVLWDKNFGGFYWEISAVEPTPQKTNKNIYGQAFGLYALSEYSRASNDPSALQLAQRLFSLLDTQVHDSRFGGYYELCTPEWERIPSPLCFNPNFPLFIKTTNTHLHLIEAFTAYYLVSKDPLAKDRLIELIFILSNAVFRKNVGACTDQYLPDWTPLAGKEFDQVSYGHDLEMLFLLSEACDAVGYPKEPFFDLYRTIYDYTYEFGFDHYVGGICKKGYFKQCAHQRQKIWWVQAEGLLSILHLYCLLKKEKYWKCFTELLEWVLTHQIDGKHEDWHRSLESSGEPTDYKYDAWKAPYHNGRAMLHSAELLIALRES